jgi:two-component system NtrC family sensor kinase
LVTIQPFSTNTEDKHFPPLYRKQEKKVRKRGLPKNIPPPFLMITRFKLSMLSEAISGHEDSLDTATRQQIVRSEKLASLGRLAAGVAHEINNPLTGVLTFAHLLREKPNMDDQDKEDLDLIIRETTRAAEIVRRLLDFSRERPVMIQQLEINEVVRRTVQLIRNQKSFEGIVIVENMGENLPDIDGDMNRLQQVILNFTLNACEAMPHGGTLTVTTLQVDNEVRLEITDTGHGIKPEVMERIFEPFFTTKPVGQGTGLGLAVSYGIIQQHGGSIEVESEEGKGTKFIIALPVGKPRL